MPDLSQFKGQKVTAEVMQFSREARNLVISRRNILERERDELKKKTLEDLSEGQVRRGTVRNVMDFGAFVDIGGVEGLLHVSELSFQRGRHKASDFLKQGDVLDVKVTKIDRETGKIGLSLRQARGIDPWADAGTRCAPGTGRNLTVMRHPLVSHVSLAVHHLGAISGHRGRENAGGPDFAVGNGPMDRLAPADRPLRTAGPRPAPPGPTSGNAWPRCTPL